MNSRRPAVRFVAAGISVVIGALGAVAAASPATAAKGAGSGTSMTNTFSPPSYVDYKSLGGEPTTVVDRYPFTPGSFGGGSTYRDVVYVSNPLGVGYPGYSEFYKSQDQGQTFLVPTHDPVFRAPTTTAGSGGGDSHQAVGQRTHRLWVVDLSGGCVTDNYSDDLGETFTHDPIACGDNPGAIDDRQWVAADETGGLSDVYINFNNDTNSLMPSISLVRSESDGTAGSFAGSPCNDVTMNANPNSPNAPVNDASPTACPDPSDPQLWISGPVTVDTNTGSSHFHTLYIPFERIINGNFVIYVAVSTDKGMTWTRRPVANVGPHDAANIFPELTIDRAGNLYYTWSQAQRYDSNNSATEGETDVYYTYSTDGGAAWAAPIDLTGNTGNSAVFPWMVAGDPGRVDLVYYQSTTGLNPNAAGVDAQGNPCDPSSDTGCTGNTSAWNTYFAQSLNALNPGANFQTSKISPHPIHYGGVCTGGTSCNGSQWANRDLLDFFTVDIDHLGAAYVTWADDNDSRNDTRQRFSRQLSGSSVFANVSINQQNSWPVTSQSATDAAGDVRDANGTPNGPCPGMDLLGDSAARNGSVLTLTLTLNGPPSAAAANACSNSATTGGLWGAEFWAGTAASPNQADNVYLAYRDNPPDGAPAVEGGYMNAISPTFTGDEFHPTTTGTLDTADSSCFTSSPPSPCTVVMSVDLTALGIKSGAAMDTFTGLSTYYFASSQQPPGFRIPLGKSELADAAPAFIYTGTTTTH